MARTDARMAFDKTGARTVLFGGRVGVQTSLAVVDNDTWLWDGANWSKADPVASPSARDSHSLVFDEARNEVVLFGGRSGAAARFDDTWTWNGGAWTRKSPPASPAARSGHAAAWDPVRNQIILFGGSTAAGDSAETWAWDGSTWTLLTPAASPAARSGAAMAWEPASQRIVLYGGSGKSDMWAWNGMAWTEITPAGASPGPLETPLLVTQGSKLVLTGGSTSVWATWLWDGAAWQMVVSASGSPARVVGAAGAWDSVRERSVFFGGTNSETSFALTWQFALGNACVFLTNAQPAPVNISAGSGLLNLDVPSPAGCPYAVQVISGDFLVPAPLPGLPLNRPTFIYRPNWSLSSRTAVVVVGGSRRYTVVQAGVACPTAGTLPPSPVTMSNLCSATWTYPARAGDSIAFRATGKGIVNPAVDSQFASYPTVTLSGPSGEALISGKGDSTTFPYAFAPASGVFTFPSTGVYTVALSASGAVSGAAKLEYITNGDACSSPPVVYDPVTVYDPQHIVASAGPNLYYLGVAVPPGCPSVTGASSAPWMTLSPKSYPPGYNTVRLDIDVNYTAQQRSATLTVGANSDTITQVASTCSYGLTEGSFVAGNGRTAWSVALLTGGSCPWKTSSDSAWAQVFPLSGTGASVIQYTIFPNFGTKYRVATLTIGGRKFIITQAPGTGTAAERFVKLLYFNFFGRVPSDAEVAFQVNSGLSSAQLASNFFHSAEFNNGGRYVAGLYIGILNRDAEYGGWLFQRDALASGVTTASVAAANFVNSQEFHLRYGAPDNRTFVGLMYRQILLREPGSGEVDFQAGALDAGLSRADLVRNLLSSQEFTITAGPRLTAFLAYAALLQRQATEGEMTSAGNVARQAQGTADIPSSQAVIRDNLLSPVVNSAEFSHILQ